MIVFNPLATISIVQATSVQPQGISIYCADNISPYLDGLQATRVQFQGITVYYADNVSPYFDGLFIGINLSNPGCGNIVRDEAPPAVYIYFMFHGLHSSCSEESLDK